MAKDPRLRSPGTYPYGNQSSWPPDDEELDLQNDYAIDGRRAYGTPFDSGLGHYAGNRPQMTDAGSGPYPCDPSPRLQSPYHPAVGSDCNRFAYHSPQQPSGGPAGSEPWELPGQEEGRVDGPGFPGPCGYDIPLTETPESFGSLPEMPQEQGRGSPDSVGAEQGSDTEFTARKSKNPASPSRGHWYHFDLYNDPNKPWSPPVNQGRPSGVDRAIDATTRFESRFGAASSTSSDRKHKKNHGKVSGVGARRDGWHSGSTGSKSKPHKTRDERRRSGQ